MTHRPLTVAWISFFPIEWLSDVPESLRQLPRLHPATWQRVLLAELEKKPSVRLHILILRKHFEKSFSFDRKGVTFHIIKTPAGLRAPSLFWLDTFLIKRVLKEIRPDLVHAWGTEQGVALVASRLRYPSVVTIQGLLSWYKELVPLNRYQRFAAFLERWSLPKATVVTIESTFVMHYLKRKFPSMNVRQVEHAPDRLFHLVQREPQTNPVRFIFVGAFSYIKGVDLLFRALDRLKDEISFVLVVIGRPEAGIVDEIRSMTSRTIWSLVQMKQDCSPTEIASELAQATMMVFPTRADTSPNAVKEAIVAGLPVVASAIGGITDYVFPGKNGYTFPSENLEAMVAAIKSACLHPLFSRGLVDADTLIRNREYLSPDRMGESFLNIYESLAHHSRTANASDPKQRQSQ